MRLKGEIMKKRIVMLILAFGMSFSMMLGGCGSSSEVEEPEEIEEEDDEDDEEDEEPEEPEEPEVIAVQALDYSDEDALLEFVYGSWTLVDKSSGSEYATMDIGNNGKVRVTLQDGTQADGNIEFTGRFNPSALTGLHTYELTLNDLKEKFNSWVDTDTSMGYFKIVRTAGRDYLYLEEVGNGGTTLSYEVFAIPDPDYKIHNSRWVFVRDNDIEAEGTPVAGETFFAFAVENGDDGILLQQLDAVSYESENEYTGYKYMEAVFDESAYPEATWYTFEEDFDQSAILYTDTFRAPFPATIYEVSTDADGKIEKISETDRAGYGAYELYSLDQEYSFTDTTFTVNGMEYELSDMAQSGSEITDCYEFGDYLVIESFSTPRENDYIFFNMRSAWKDREILGNNLLLGNSLQESFYTDLNVIYDLFGEPVYMVDGDEIYGLEFVSGGKKIKISYWTDNYNSEAEETIDLPECLNAPIFAYSTYRHNRDVRNWNEFLKYAPEDALFMIMVNPYPDDAWDFYMPMDIDGGSDIVYFVALDDGVMVSFGDGNLETLSKGEMTAFAITVPEGGPTYYLSGLTKDGRSGTWPVATISGKDDIRWVFIEG